MKKVNFSFLFLILAGFALFPGSILANNFSNYSILAQNSVHIKKKAAILSGFVGVNEPSTVLTPEDEGVQLLVDKEVLFEEETRLVAPSILIKRESTIHGDIDYQDRLTIQDKVTVTGDVNILNGPADWPLVSFPIPPGCTPDLTNVFMVKEGSQSHMPPGHYGDVSIGRNATVTFDGGEYHFSSFRIDKEAKVYFSSPATICIANSFQTDSDTFFGPKNDDTTLSGADIRFYVNGVDFPEAEGDGHSGEDQDLEAIAKIGKKNVFFGQIFALNGTLEIENAVQANGAYIARDIVVGKNSVITRNTSPAPVDTTPPVIIGINPAEGSVLNDSTPTFSANFQDADSGINPASIQILLDGQDVTLQADVSEMGFSFIPAALTDGPHVLSIRVDDNAGNNTQSTVNFTINTDATPPQILNVLPVDGSLLAGTPPQISADFYDDTAVDASSVQILLDNVDITAQSSVTATGFNILVTAVLNDGSHTFLISVRDTAGNLAQVSTNFKIDTLPPDIEISVPADGSLLATVTPTISGNFGDAIAGIDENSVRIFVDGANLTSQAIITQTAFTAPVTDALNNGAHMIMVEVADLAGNAAVQTSAFTIDTIAPVISNLTPAHMSTITANLPLISAGFADSGSGVDILSAQILADNINVTPQATIAETGFNYTPSIPLNNGYHTIVVTVADVADNIAQAAYSFNVLLDQAPPTIFNMTPAAGNLLATSTPTLSASFEDNLTGVSPLSAQILLDGTDVTAQTNVTASGFSFVPSPLGDGGHTLSISIRDNQGNAAQASVNFTTDTAAPVISNIAPADGSTIAVDTPTISADFSDTVSGIDISSVQILVDGNNRTAQAVVAEGGFDLTIGSPLANGSHTVDIRVADIAGNTTQIHSGFTVFIHEPTQVSGTISQNTTWTLAQSPYLVAGNIIINGGVTLTIEAGVVVKFSGFYFIDGQGVIHAQGTSGNRITFTSNKTTPAVGDWNNITIRDANSILDYVTIEYADRGVYVPSYASNPATIQNSLIQHNNNGIYFEPGTGPSILSNTIVNNNVGIFAGCNVYTGCSPKITDNNIHSNLQYGIQAYSYGSNASGTTINAQNNWWGSIDVPTIEGTIYHNADDASLAVADYDPFLDGPGGNPIGIPPSAPVLNGATPGKQQVSLQWTMDGLAMGYKIKYGTSSGVYDTTLDVGNVTAYDVTGLTIGTPYYFAVVAYNNSGESGPSNELMQTPIDATLASPLIGQDTIWTLADSPYLVMGDVTINTSATLTIEPGVEVRFTGFYSIIANGILNAQGTAVDMITFGSNSATPVPGDWNRIYSNNSNSRVVFAHIQHANVGIFSDYSNMIISDSIIENNVTGIHIKGTSTTTVTRNDIINNTQAGIVLQAGYPLSVPQPNIHFNSIFHNGTYNLQTAYETVNFNHSGSVIKVENNWWGTDIPAGIAASIWDYYDSNYRPHVDWSPYLVTDPGMAIHITNVSVSGNAFNPVRLETAQINYAVDTDSEVTIRIYDENTDALVRTLINAQPRPAGSHAESWDGRDDSAQLLPPGAYTCTISAQTTDGKKGLYAPVQLDDSVPTVLNATVTPTGAFNPFRGERLAVNYDLSDFARVSWGYGKSATVAYVDNEPKNMTGNVDYWDGRDTAGNIVVLPNEPFYVQAQTTRLPENTIILDNRTTLDVPVLFSNPYLIRPLYNQVTEITYALNAPATVTVSILTPDGAQTLNVLEQGASKSAGTYTLLWDGKTVGGETVTQEGDYRIRVGAVDSFGVTTRRDGNIRILY